MARVSILVVLDDWFGVNAGETFTTDFDVSILVVLDDWFGVEKVPELALYPFGFNPCCFG